MVAPVRRHFIEIDLHDVFKLRRIGLFVARAVADGFDRPATAAKVLRMAHPAGSETSPAPFAQGWWMDVFDQLSSASDAGQLFQRISLLVQGVGFQYCSYARFSGSASVGESSAVAFDSYPPPWFEHYVECDYIRVDPTVVAGARLTAPIVWSDRTFANTRQLWSDAREFGLNTGISQSAWGPFGAFGLLSCARTEDPVSDHELRRITPALQWLAECSHRMMHQFMFAAEPRMHIVLSSRETETLKWTAEGKTAWEISQILRISENTVAFHLKNAIAKLDSRTKAQAVARATALGLLFPMTVTKGQNAAGRTLTSGRARSSTRRRLPGNAQSESEDGSSVSRRRGKVA